VARNQHSQGWKTKLTVYVVSATMVAGASGAILGFLGSLLPADARIGIATVLGLVAVALGLLEALGPRIVLLQCNRETPQAWVARGPLRWALLNGAALGFGGGTRLGFWLWYAIPIGAFLFGTPAVGALVYGAFGATRTAAAGLLMEIGHRQDDFHVVTDWLFTAAPLARLLAACVLLTVGLTIIVGVGL
jgi:hypothetical protein